MISRLLFLGSSCYKAGHSLSLPVNSVNACYTLLLLKHGNALCVRLQSSSLQLSFQSGFGKSHSISLFYFIYYTWKDQQKILNIVHHAILFSKLKCIGLNDTEIKWVSMGLLFMDSEVLTLKTIFSLFHSRYTNMHHSCCYSNDALWRIGKFPLFRINPYWTGIPFVRWPVVSKKYGRYF